MTDPDRPAAGGTTESTEEAPFVADDEREAVPSFGDLSLPQRAFVAAAQNPSRGILIVGLFAFSLFFYATFWLAFPRVAGFLSAIGVVVVLVAVVVYRLLNRTAE